MERKILSTVVLIISMFCATHTAQAAINLTIGDLNDFVHNLGPCDIVDYANSGVDLQDTDLQNPVLGDNIKCGFEYFLANKLTTELAKANITLAGGQAIYEEKQPDKTLNCSFCDPQDRISITHTNVVASVSSDSQINLNAHLPKNLSADLAFEVNATVTGTLVFEKTVLIPTCLRWENVCPVAKVCKPGVKGCEWICPVPEVKVCTLPGVEIAGWAETGRIDFIASINNLEADATMNVDLNYSWDPANDRAVIAPAVALDGNITVFDPNRTWSIDFTGANGITVPLADIAHVLRNELLVVDIDPLLGTVIAKTGENKLNKKLEETKNKIQQKLDSAIGEVFFPSVATQALAVGLANKFFTEVPPTLINIITHDQEFLFNLLVGNKDAVKTMLQSGLACLAADWTEVANMPHLPLYQQINGVCQAVDPQATTTGQFYSESLCTAPIEYQATSNLQFCQDSLNPTVAGNAEVWDTSDTVLEESPWTLTLGNRLRVNFASIENDYQPYMKKVEYKVVDNSLTNPAVAPADKLCKLEMRIYKKDIAATNLKPLMAIHGGSWSYRGAGFLGLESEIADFTEKGFVVFLPFYRLTGTLDGNSACNGVSGDEIDSDINDAFAWISNHKSQYGATGKINVFGQSAGGHLAAKMAVEHPAEVEKALLLYPPIDFHAYFEELGPCAKNAGTLKRVLGDTSSGDCLELPLTDQSVFDNSLPQKIEINPSVYPSMYILHGNSDTLVPSSQSVRLCNSLSGNAGSVTGPAYNSGGDTTAGQFSQAYQCDDRGSRLVLFTQANHMFDGCPIGTFEDIIRSSSSNLSEEQVTDMALDNAAKYCFAGSKGSIAAIKATLENAFNWLAPYCDSKGNSTSFEWIQEVDVNGTSFTTGNNHGYHMSNQPVSFQYGANYVTLVPGFSSGRFKEYWKIWIDLNQNRVFDSNEVVYSGNSNSVLAPSINIPVSALTGETGMRISMFFGVPNATSCGSNPWGEVEDYTIIIK